MKKLDWYMIRELLVPLLIGTVAVTLMFQANTYMFYAKNYRIENVPAVKIFAIIYHRTPEFLAMTLPVGMALAGSLAMARLARESELTALRAAGVRILRTILPIAVVGVLVSLLNYHLVENIQPGATRESNRIAYDVGFEGSLPQVNENVPLRLERYSAFLGRVERTLDGGLDIRNVLLVERPEQSVWLVTTAEQATYQGGVWRFVGAYLRRFDGEKLTQAGPAKDFKVDEEIVVDQFMTPAVPEALSTQELRERIEMNRRLRFDTRPDEIKYHVKFSVPAACIVFALISPVFSIFFARSGSFVGVLLSIVMVLVYYNAFVISTEILGKFAFMPTWLAAWLPNFLFSFLALFGIRRLE
jgi:lipopolysaccharide export system permease protein